MDRRNNNRRRGRGIGYESPTLHYNALEKDVLCHEIWYDPDNHFGISRDMFDVPENIAIFDAIENLRKEGKIINIHTVSVRLDRRDIPHSMSYDDAITLFTSYNTVTDAATHLEHIGALRECELRRKLLRLESDLVNGNISVEQYFSDMFTYGDTYMNYLNNDRFSKYDLPNTFKEMQRTIALGDENIPTGYHLGHGDYEFKIPARGITLVVLPTSHGKSTILNNLCLNIATTTDVNSLYITLEEHRDRVFVNLLNCFARIPLGRNNREIIRKELRGIYTKEELNATKYSIKEKHDYMSFLENKKAQAEYLIKKSEFAKLIENSHRINIQSPNMDIDDLIDYLAHMKRKYNIGVVFIDYAQLLRVADRSNFRSRGDEIKYIMDRLKDFSNDEKNGLPVVLAAQFNRDVRYVRDMALNKIGEGCNLEFYADTILLGYYCFRNPQIDDPVERDKINKIQGTKAYNDKVLYVRLDKGRSGQTGQTALWPVSMNCCYVADEGCPLPEEIYSETISPTTHVTHKTTDNILML